MSEKFTVIEGGKYSKARENNALQSMLDKINAAIAPFQQFVGLDPELETLAMYHDQTIEQLAYEAERLSQALKDPSIKLVKILDEAVALRAVLMMRS